MENNFNSIDLIHNHFLNQAMIFEYDNLDQNVFDSIDRIVLINSFNRIDQCKYIEFINYINKKNIELAEKLKQIAFLTEMFLSLSNKISILDQEMLVEIFDYYYFSKKPIEDFNIEDNFTGEGSIKY